MTELLTKIIEYAMRDEDYFIIRLRDQQKAMKVADFICKMGIHAVDCPYAPGDVNVCLWRIS